MSPVDETPSAAGASPSTEPPVRDPRASGSGGTPAENDRRKETAAETPLSLEAFLGEPTRSLGEWARLWGADLEFPVRAGGGLRGRIGLLLKRLLRPILRSALGDLYDRQRVFNLILLETLVKQRELATDRFRAHQGHLEVLDARTIQGLQEVMRHNDALFARVDQKLDRYRREAKELWHRLGALIAAAEVSADGEPAPRPGTGEASRVLLEQEYLSLEARYRGSEEDIAERVSAYLPHLGPIEGLGAPLLDLGCGRGEALEVFRRAGHRVEGVDSSSEMVACCREKGLEVEEGDLFTVLAGRAEGSLGAVVSFHVIEHLEPISVSRLVRLAWRALAPGGMLILETPSPLALAMSARDFWMDPTHRRPVHPSHLEVSFREAGFEPVHRVDLRPFPDDQHLPELELSAVPEAQRPLADHVNRLRDLLDDLLFGNRDFGLVGHKPR
ncbi:MAG: class I SAM-dependent methyltransferase [Holophagales bacterium]|nr:class I SAM-dependent methyltransferase [Holophagales bacterium]